MHKTHHLRLKINIVVPTHLYAINKFEQNEQNDDATHLLYLHKKTWTLCKSQKHLLMPNSQERYVNPKCNGTKFTEASKKI